MRGVCEDEYRTAEPTAEEARAERARVGGQLDEQVELRNRDVVVVAKALVALIEDRAGRDEISGLEGAREPSHALVLAHDVPQSPHRDLIEPLVHSGLDVGGASDADESQRALELAPPLGIGGVLEAPANTGIDDHEPDVRRNRDRSVLERVAVEQDRALGGSEQARGLVEDPARHAHRSQLRPLAEESELERLELEVGHRAESERERHLEGGRRRETPSRREVGRDRPRQADRGPTRIFELGGDRLHVSPPSTRPRAASVGGDGLRSPVPLGLERDLVPRGSCLEPDPVLDRDGQDEPTAVVGVLPDEVDPSRRPDAERRLIHVHAMTNWWSPGARLRQPLRPTARVDVNRSVRRRAGLRAVRSPRRSWCRLLRSTA